MKNYFPIYILLVAIIGLQVTILARLCKCTAVPSNVISREKATTAAATPTPTPLPTPTPTPAPTNENTNDEKLLVEVNNIYACSYTDKADFTLDKDYFITRIRTWYSWLKDEAEINYTLLKGDKEITKGVLARKDCDPYQKQWCIAADYEFNKELSSGDYVIKVENARICQNAQSNNKGMIFVWGKE